MEADSGVLVVAAERLVRRNLFDALDRAGCLDIYTARDIQHAAILLAGRPSLKLLIVVFSGGSQQARQCCMQLRLLPGGAEAPMIAVLAEDGVLLPSDLPPDVSDWLYAARIDAELVARWHRLLIPKGVPASSVKPGDVSRNEDSFPTFGNEDAEWLIADVQHHRVLEFSPALTRHSGLPAGQWHDVFLFEMLVFEDMAVEKISAAMERKWRPCKRKSSRGFDSGHAIAWHLRQDGRDVLALLFRSDRAEARAETALSLLARVFTPIPGIDAVESTARLLFEELGLDYLAIWSARRVDTEAPALLLQLCNGEPQAWTAAHLQNSLQQVLEGRPIFGASKAQPFATADSLPQMGFAAVAGIPLYDERRTVLGAMLAGSRAAFAEVDVVEPVLRCAAARLAQALELQRTREQGRAEGLVDALTGLPNRMLFNDRVDTIIREANRNGECFAVLFVDLDHFKEINDSHGHAAGDQVLRMVTQRLRGSVRASDTLARYAGDEFIVVLRHIVKNEDVLRVAEKIVQLMEAPLYLDDGTGLKVTASMGLSFFPDDAGDTETLLRHADEAMYAAKHHGRNNFKIYEVSPEYARQHGTMLRSRLRHAEGNGELRVVYQPQVHTVSEDIVGMEALVRWEHPELGMISPAVFIPLAEETGLIVSIGEWVMRTACRQAQEWEQQYGLRLRLGVNLSAVQLMEPQLLDTVHKILRETGLDPALLELEITESISIKAAPNLVENLDALHRLGCHIAIDDFGTGAASLDYLRRLPADRIKIDQSFVRNIGVDPDDEAIVRATIDMAHRLNRAVVAEGVEIEQHFEFLRAHHCDELQGYLFCRPLQPVSFDNLLAERQRLLGVRRSATA